MAFVLNIIPLEERIVLDASVTIIYVDANISRDSTSTIHDGTSWATAFSNLQDALTKASSSPGPDQIWIAKGTYIPTQIYAPVDANGNSVVGGAAGINSSNMVTFNIPNNVSLYGGFLYGMTSLSQRNPTLYQTILSGDIKGNDINNPTDPGYAASKADNAWHVLTLGNDVTQQGVTATLDGLTIIDGNAIGPNNGGTLSPFIWGHSDGGGVYIAWGSTVTVNNDTFLYNNAASDGGGLFSNTSNILVTNSSFLNNSAGVRAGALEGLNDFENGISHTSILNNDYFANNTSLVFGGAVVGEGAYQGANSLMNISNSTFVHNKAAEGGAVVIDTLTVNITKSTFTNNIATVDAGALATTNVVGTLVHAPNTYATTISYSSFYGNVALNDPTAHANLNNFVGVPGLNFAGGGGALVTYMNGYMNVNYDLFVNNVAQNGDGGAILNGDASANLFGISAFAVQTRINGSTFIHNQALNGNGGAIASESDLLSPTSTVNDTQLTLLNSILLSNDAAAKGGGIYIDSSIGAVKNDVVALNQAVQGDGLYGHASILNGLASSDPNDLKALKSTNLFLDDIFLS